MFQESSDNADDTDVFCLSFHSGDQAADTADDHIDLDSGLRSLDQFVDDLFVRKGIQFESCISFFSVSCMCDLFVQHTQHFILQTLRCYKKMPSMFNNFSLRQCLKYIGSFQPDLYIGCHQREIRI